MVRVYGLRAPSFLAPGVHLRPADSRMPSVVVKTGLDTPHHILVDYKYAWLEGGSAVNVSTLIKLEATEDKYVRGRMVVWRKGALNPQTFVSHLARLFEQFRLFIVSVSC